MKSKAVAIILSIVAVLFVLTMNFSLWLNGTIFDRENFSKITVDTIQQSEVTDAISAELVDTALQNRPLVKNLVGDTVQSAISGLLASERLQPVLEKLADRFNVLLTSKTPQEVVIDTTGVKTFIKPLANAINEQSGGQISDANLPDEVVLVQKGEIPSIYSWGVVMIWLGPILGFIGIGIFVALIWAAGAQYRQRSLKITGISLIVSSLLFIILVGSTKSSILASVTNSNAKVIADNLFSAYTNSLTNRTWILAIIGGALTVTGYFLPQIKQSEAFTKLKRAA